ncbi:putative DNA-binding protein [Streptomyces ambofaciens ATCC 23877]|uniref:XRE family transcriptional regulator n=2 Tax=Streptomyces ambofaciens TaxID=1889 RepID=A0ABN4PKN2_STRAM|nr:helix-turn-helix transcriptional regulator [Streptomyces ambofaciens]AKZ60185.1 putative DNA-binding protein [Streptomyces ambofaciens ATCC 23877]ANB10394.1 XRE family transcriptional regulator [Streptomyces ambofaciens]CAJ88161.1 putative DNA-binding protein [Streptomyces ambofaciens ATCC 23877]
MDNREEVREFLTSRRARITPEQADLPAGPRRRVPGLRRSEVAALADMSVEYYAKLERGSLAGASPAVLEALARALRLDDAERAHLLHLAQAADGSDVLARPRRRATTRQWTPHRSLQWTLDAVTAGPAVVTNGRMDILAANALGRAFYTDLFAHAGNQRNLARFNFLDPAARTFYPDWDLFADMAVAILRREAGRDPHDKDLHDLVGELSTRSDDFRARWGAHDVRRHGTGTKRFRHPAVGDLTLAYESLDLAAEPGLSMTVYTAEPGSASEEGLRLLASLAATEEATSAVPGTPGVD